MKKFILLLICTATLGLVSCKKETITPQIFPRTILYDIPANAWKTGNGGLTYRTTINVKENDENFNQSGGVIVALAFDAQKRVFDALPNVVEGLSYTFTSEPGYVDVYIDAVDGGRVEVPPTGPIRIKIVLVDSEIID